MKHTKETIHKKDSGRAFKLAIASLQHRLQLGSWMTEGVFQYDDNIEGGHEYITVELFENKIIFHVLTKYDDPKIIGKIDLSQCDKNDVNQPHLNTHYFESNTIV